MGGIYFEMAFQKGHTSWIKGRTKATDNRVKTPKTAFKKGQIPWNKGKSIDKIKYPNYGTKNYKHSQLSKEKMSSIQKGLYSKGMSSPCIGANGKDNPMYGKKHSDEWKKNMSLKMTGKKHTEETKIKMRKNSVLKNRLSFPDNEMVSMYNKGVSINKIAEKFKCSRGLVYSRLNEKKVKFIGNKKFHNRQSEILDLYKKSYTICYIAESMKCDGSVIRRILEENHIKPKNKKFLIGGFLFEPYGREFNPILKKAIRKRDNYTCQECKKIEEGFKEGKGNYHRRLSIHHINYCKQDNDPFNLIALCNNCHQKTNFNREHWTKYFRNIMALRQIFNPKNMLIFNENKQLVAINRI